MLVDQADIQVRAGKGGDGCVSFLRERFMPRGGPNGGDGGDGASVYAVATPGVDTLLDFAGRHHWRAENGAPGMGKDCAGRKGEDLFLKLPQGTRIYDRESGILLKDMADAEEPVCIARGGKGGRGNARFATPTHQTPRECEQGTPGEERLLRLELSLIADVGIVGLPNAGKSTLLSRVSKARPKIADYPFTTLEPQLGIAELSGFRRIVLADIPGLIEGANEGAGLGTTFLRHIERTRVILHLVDVSGLFGGPPPLEAYGIVREELRQHSEALASKVELVAANKMDTADADPDLTALDELVGRRVHRLSAVTGMGVDALLESLWTLLENTPRSCPNDSSATAKEQEPTSP